MFVRIRTTSGFFRDIRPRAGFVTIGLMFVLAFIGGAVGLIVATLYCLPIPLSVFALVGLGELMIPVFASLALTGAGAAMGLLTAALVNDKREEKALRRQRQVRVQADPGPWGRCMIRQDKLRDSIMNVHQLPVVPRRWR